jgi:hypothetical protein
MTEKFILDACCGPKNMWYNKNHPNTLYIDIRREPKGYNSHNKGDSVQPDIIADFRCLPKSIKEKKFKLIVWDLPHMVTLGKTSMFRKKYGCLNAQTWPADIKSGFNELWSVLENYGTLLMKFNDSEISFKSLFRCIPKKPLFYNITSAHGKKTTKWFCFMKIPEEKT